MTIIVAGAHEYKGFEKQTSSAQNTHLVFL